MDTFFGKNPIIMGFVKILLALVYMFMLLNFRVELLGVLRVLVYSKLLKEFFLKEKD